MYEGEQTRANSTFSRLDTKFSMIPITVGIENARTSILYHKHTKKPKICSEYSYTLLGNCRFGITESPPWKTTPTTARSNNKSRSCNIKTKATHAKVQYSNEYHRWWHSKKCMKDGINRCITIQRWCESF